MKFGYLLCFILLLAVAMPADPQQGQTEGFQHKNGEDVLVNLQGENNEVWIVSFFQPGDNNKEVREQIKATMAKDLKDEKYQYGEVSLLSGYEYQKLFETLDLVGEPKRGHTTPQVLLMQNGEGYMIYGPNIANAIVKRYKEVVKEKPASAKAPAGKK